MQYPITIKAEMASTLAANLPTAALTSAGFTSADINALAAELNRAAVALRESASPSDNKVTVNGVQVPAWRINHGQQKY